jgi:glutathione reductase (NADPH)
MDRFDYDLFVIGGGSGGVRAARVAAELGARVALVEERYLGGTCVNVGCVPKKLLVHGAQFAEAFEDARGFGWSLASPSFTWRSLIANKDREIARLNGVYRGLLEGAGVTVFDGRGTIEGPHTVSVNGHRARTANILVATGSWPFIPEIPGREHYATSNDLFHLDRLPERIVIGGGGYVAVEFAGIFHGFGAQVIQVYRGPLFMRGFDEDVRRFLAEEMGKKGIALHFHCTITRIEKAGEGYRVHLSDGSVLEAELVIAAMGRTPVTRNFGLERMGVKLGDSGGVLVNGRFQTNVPSIYAVGDVLDQIKLTPVALAEGMTLARNLFGGQDERLDYRNVPTAVFSQPSVGAVGLTEQEARERHGAIRVFKTAFRPLKHTLSGRDELTLMKLIVDAKTDRVLGCHMVGAEAGEIIQGLAIALKCGATKAQFDATIGIHPTSAEEFVTMRAPDPETAHQAVSA